MANYEGKKQGTGAQGATGTVMGGTNRPSFVLKVNPNPEEEDSKLIRVTGLFSREGKKGASVRLKEDITLPAGAYLHVFPEE